MGQTVDDFLIVRDGDERSAIHLHGGRAAIYAGAEGNEGDVIVRDGSGRNAFHLDGNRAAIYVGAEGNEGDVIVRDGSGRNAFHLDGNRAAIYVGAEGNEGDVIVRDGDGNTTIHLDGNTGDIVLRNADAAEEFRLADGADARPGAVMVADHNGGLVPCEERYDPRVVGVVAGAGRFHPGIVFDSRPDARQPRAAISMLGKVTCQVDASERSVRVGDLLTSSATPGHAMAVVDRGRAFGSIIGKALSPLDEGLGHVSMVIGLQ